MKFDSIRFQNRGYISTNASLPLSMLVKLYCLLSDILMEVHLNKYKV